MKTVLITSLFLIVFFIGCGGGGDSSSSYPNPQEANYVSENMVSSNESYSNIRGR